MESINGRQSWAYGRLIDEGWLPGGLEESRARLEEDRNPESDEFFQRYNDLLEIAEKVDEGEKADFLAETTFIVRMAQRDLESTDSLETEYWNSDLENYLGKYFGETFQNLPDTDYEDAYEADFPPEELEKSDFYRDTFDILEGLKNATGIEDDIQRRIKEYTDEYSP
jgi:hypothetical protein